MYKVAKCEEFQLWAITNISERTKKYFRMVTYGVPLTETTVEYESLLGSDEWKSFVPKKQSLICPTYLPHQSVLGLCRTYIDHGW
eukprot:15222058-Ditylum_brightwellii.AAC.1